MIGELRDQNKNGELIQIGPTYSTGSGSIAGVVLYMEGFIVLTGSWSLHDQYTDFFDVYDASTLKAPSWLYFLTSGSNNLTDLQNERTKVGSSSFALDFEGTERIPSLTMFAHAERGEFNFSNNPTFIEYGQTLNPFTSSTHYRERDNIKVKNIADVKYEESQPLLEKTTYISSIGIYDEEGNLIAIAKLATPKRKRQNDELTFKLTFDL